MTKGFFITSILAVALLVGATAWSDNSSLLKVEELNGEVIRLYQHGRYSEAIAYAEKALTIYEKTKGPKHPHTATSLNNLAVLYEAMGAYDKAEPLYKRSLAIDNKTLGPGHHGTADTINNLAVLYAIQGRYGEALTLMERSQDSDRRQTEQILGFASEAQQAQFLATKENNFFFYISLIRQRFLDNSKIIRNALDVWLARKGILLEAQKLPVTT